MVHGDFKDLPKGTASDELLHKDHNLMLLKIQNMIGIKKVLLQWFINFSRKYPILMQINLLPVVVLKTKICQTSNYLEKYTN